MQLLVRYGSVDAAAAWALRYHLPRDRLPERVAEEMEALRLQERYRKGAACPTLRRLAWGGKAGPGF